MMTSTRGLSLIEVMIAMVILAVGILAMGATAGAVTTTLTGSRAATQASQMAMGEIEKLRVAARSTKPACSAATFSSSVFEQNWLALSLPAVSLEYFSANPAGSAGMVPGQACPTI